MKLNSTVLLTLILLTLMLGAGSVSAILGFDIGSKALKGVTTPDARPATKFASSKANSMQHGGVTLLREEEILKVVKSRIEGKSKASKLDKSQDDEEEEKAKKEKEVEKAKEAQEKPQPGFPISAESQGVNLAVQSAQISGGDLVLKVKMQNKGTDTAQFLYSFLDVTDDKGRTLSASTEGLPTELPSNSPVFSGTISIPTPLLEDVKRVSLVLTDYPAQKMHLEVANIPVGK
ncbi:hypothetical protein [Calothrix sp. PCC 6303]|uniref:hypothetical protein n=1 Tax=Calothrix sp. PCC 6303 TaxID=1170562 RepID=UPI0002A02FEA|nr:hypothetical protein [Calothrix sp. PCC 6303]AFY99741.1 hypothetical protein Cal6303_0670 [Calothrix sp. PCC 6303]